MTKNVYIHIPFCVKKCNYCAFTSYNKIQLKTNYVNALLKEIKTNYKNEELDTLYFGGGTPSLLSIEEVKQIISCFNFTSNTEITFEVNPNKLKFEYLQAINSLGVNRLSIGVQTFDENILKIIGRLHTPQDIENAVKNAKLAGFKNISLDLIYGLPTQTLENFSDSLKKAINLNIEHISLYGLKIENGTVFAIKKPKDLPDDDLQADMYLLADNILQNANFEKYEISNYSKQGYNSRHNLNYWNANTYYGFGCGACGYENNHRYENQSDLEKYIENPLLKTDKYKLTQQEKIEETIFLGFRKASGIDLNSLKNLYDYDFEKRHKKTLEKYINTKHIIKTPKGYAFSNEGFLVSNEILCEFLA